MCVSVDQYGAYGGHAGQLSIAGIDETWYEAILQARANDSRSYSVRGSQTFNRRMQRERVLRG